MAAESEQIFKALLELQKVNQAQITDVTNLLGQLTVSMTQNLHNRPSAEVLFDTLARSIENFTPSENSTFGQWYARNKSVFITDGASLSDDARTRLLLRKLSQEAYDKYVNLILPKKPDEVKFKDTVEELSSMFGETKSLFQQRYDCLNVEKSPSEDFVTYGSRINRLCEDFKISTITPDQFKSLIFVLGMKAADDSDVRTRLLAIIEDDTRNTDINVGKLVTEAKRIQTIKTDAALLQSSNTVHGVQSSQKHNNNNKKNKNNNNNNNKGNKYSGTPSTPCWGCGEMHYYIKSCPFREKQCPDCNKKGHKAGFCNAPKPKKFQQKDNQGNVGFVESGSSCHHVNAVRKRVNVEINQLPITLQIDSGSDFTIISVETFNKIGCANARSPTHHAFDASSNTMAFVKEFDAAIKLFNQIEHGTVLVTTNPNLNILGADFMQKFGLFDRPINEVCLAIQSKFGQQLQSEFPQLFSDTPGLVDKFLPKLYLVENAKSIFRQKRQVPFAMMKPVEDELDRLIKLKVIEPVEYSENAAPIVSVRKSNGTVRVCGDYATGLNDQLQSCHHPLPTREEILAKLSGSKIFTKIDLSDAFLQILIHPDSRKLLTINTHKGLFQFNRLAPGVKPAPGIFQQIIDSILADIPGAAAYLDDILCYAKTQKEHDEVVRKVCARLQGFNFRIKIGKCDFNLPEVKYLGCIINGNGTSPDPDKISAITNMQAPTNISQLRSVLGSINYHSRYIKNLRQIRAPLDELTKKDTPWCWSEDCQRAFNDLKAILTSDLHLVHYDPSLKIIVSADASPTGIGAYLSHEMPDKTMKMVACGSRPLSPAEKNYSQIEKEGLSIVYAVKKFHRYIFGRHFILRTDHRPLLRIFGSHKGIPQHVANRLQRWAEILLSYDFKVVHIKTEDFGYVDILSRLMQRFQQKEEDFVIAHIEEDLAFHVKNVASKLPLNHQQITTATLADPTLIKVQEMMQNGWPESRKNVPDPELQQFWPHRDELTVVEGVILFEGRVVVPKIHRKTVIEKLHEAHPGIERMKSLARSYVFWPNINKDLADRVQSCPPCARSAKMPNKHLLHSWPMATQPMERIHIDIAEAKKGDFYLVMVDAYSKWPEVIRTSTVTSNFVITTLSSLFSRFGKPQLIVTDNGPQFISEEFSNFCHQQGVQHLTTAYYQSQSNGEAERFIDTLKRHLERITSGGEKRNPLDLFLQYYRSTPNQTIENKTPAELFLGRKLRIDLDLLRPTERKPKIINLRQNEQFNRKHAAKKRTFCVGDLVLAKVYSRNNERWIEGQITQKFGDVMYEVEINENGVTRKLRSHANQVIPRRYKLEDNQQDDAIFDLLVQLQCDPDAIVASFQPAPEELHELTALPAESDEEMDVEMEPELRRSNRDRRLPPYLQENYVLQ